MGLRDDLLADIAEAFDSDLSDAMKSFVLNTSTGAYDPITETYGTTQSYSSRGVFIAVDGNDYGNKFVEGAEYQIIILTNEIAVKPQQGEIISQDSLGEFNILKSSADPTDSIYTVFAGKPSN